MTTSASTSATKVVEDLFEMMRREGQSDYIGEPISQIEHALQAAECAMGAGAREEVTIAALLHDIGQFLPTDLLNFSLDPTFALDANNGRASHEHIGSTYLQSLGFFPTVCALVRDHVVAKRYLTATEGGYWESLSEASKASLVGQGGPFTQDECRRFEQDPLFEEKVAMRRFDDRAKVVGMEVPGLEVYRDMVIGVLGC
ncbi:hypothetical protein PM082_006624 [Marasmius tenuissimus]|nr:hypothetical protein PM082_006624 [Marasmius tenuissimus]